MAADLIYLSPLWWRTLALVRLLLGLSVLVAVVAGSPQFAWTEIALAVAFAIYSTLALIWRRLAQGGYALPSLLVDTIVFLICAMQTFPHSLWLNSLFYVYLLLAAALIHTWREVILVVGVCLFFFSVASPPRADFLLPLVVLAGILACTLALLKQVLIQRMSVSARQAVMFRSESERARESERQRIAADFHDGPLQSFIGFQMRLEVLRKVLERDPAVAAGELRQLQELCSAQVTELRSFVRSMRPLDVDGASLNASIRRLVESFKKESGIQTTFSSADEIQAGENPALLEILQIVREALHNVQKHSNASRVSVSLEMPKDVLEIVIEDDGAGFPFSGTFGLDELELLRLGPMSIKRRVRSLGGDLVLQSRPGRGSGLRVRIPA